MLKYNKHILYTKDFSKCAHAAMTSSLLLTKLLILTTGDSHTFPLSFHFTALLKIIWIEYEQTTTALEFFLSLLPRTKEKGEELRYAFVAPGVFFQPRAVYNKKQAKNVPKQKKKTKKTNSELRGVFYFNEAILGFMVSVSSVSKTPKTLKRPLFGYLFIYLSYLLFKTW